MYFASSSRIFLTVITHTHKNIIHISPNVIMIIFQQKKGDRKLFANLYFFGFNFFYIMIWWCLLRTMVSDPGKIPLFWVNSSSFFSLDFVFFTVLYHKFLPNLTFFNKNLEPICVQGFFLDDPEHKKRRYCLICHIFKVKQIKLIFFSLPFFRKPHFKFEKKKFIARKMPSLQYLQTMRTQYGSPLSLA